MGFDKKNIIQGDIRFWVFMFLVTKAISNLYIETFGAVLIDEIVGFLLESFEFAFLGVFVFCVWVFPFPAPAHNSGR